MICLIRSDCHCGVIRVENMNVEEFEKRAETIVDDELNNIKTMLQKIPTLKREMRRIDLN